MVKLITRLNIVLIMEKHLNYIHRHTAANMSTYRYWRVNPLNIAFFNEYFPVIQQTHEVVVSPIIITQINYSPPSLGTQCLYFTFFDDFTATKLFYLPKIDRRR